MMTLFTNIRQPCVFPSDQHRHVQSSKVQKNLTANMHAQRIKIPDLLFGIKQILY